MVAKLTSFVILALALALVASDASAQSQRSHRMHKQTRRALGKRSLAGENTLLTNGQKNGMEGLNTGGKPVTNGKSGNKGGDETMHGGPDQGEIPGYTPASAGGKASLGKVNFPTTCGKLGSGHANAFNSGIDFSKFKTIISLGDSMTAGFGDNKPSAYPSSGKETDFMKNKHVTNGHTWMEQLAGAYGWDRWNGASSGAVVDSALTTNGNNDLVHEYQAFLKVKGQLPNLDKQSTLCSAFFGINDQGRVLNMGLDSKAQVQHVDQSANELIDTINKLSDVCSGALFINSLGPTLPFRQQLEAGLASGKLKMPYAYVNDYDLMQDLSKNKEKYGFKATGPCIEKGTSNQYKALLPWQQCQDSVFFVTQHPTEKTHGYMASYIQQSVQSCRSGGTASTSDGSGGSLGAGLGLKSGNGQTTQPKGAGAVQGEGLTEQGTTNKGAA